MIFNLSQKYASVISSFINTVLIISLFDLAHLGLFAFLTASATIFAVLIPLGLRSIYLREIVKCRGDIECQRCFTALTEIVPKLSSVVFAGLFVAAASLTPLSIADAISIVVIGSMLASAQLSSQKLRSYGLNSLSQFVLNSRPIVLTVLLLGISLLDEETRQTYFLTSIITSFAVPAVAAYVFWMVKFRHLVFARVAPADIAHRARASVRETPGLFMLALGQKVMARSDVILVTALLNLEAAGIYRICTQIVTVANASLYPIRSKFLKKYSKLLTEQKTAEAAKVAGRVARFGVPLYVFLFLAGLLIIYQGPYLQDIKYRPDFMISLGILGLVGLIKALIPMIESYVVFRNNSNKGGAILFAVVLGNLVSNILLIPLLGLPGACLTTLMTVVVWRYTVKRFL